VSLPAFFEEVRARLEREAIESAYKQQVEHLFSTWVKDGGGSPERARRGLAIAREVFKTAMEALDGEEEG